MVLSLACAMIEEKRCPESAREAINAHRTRWFRVTHSFASVCVVFFPRAVRRAHPLDKERERRRCRAKSSLSPPNKECTDVGVPHEKERGNLSLSRISRVFYPSRGFKNASNVEKRSSEMRCVRVREKLRVLRARSSKRGCTESARGWRRREEERNPIGCSFIRTKREEENFFLRVKTLNIH